MDKCLWTYDSATLARKAALPAAPPYSYVPSVVFTVNSLSWSVARFVARKWYLPTFVTHRVAKLFPARTLATCTDQSTGDDDVSLLEHARTAASWGA